MEELDKLEEIVARTGVEYKRAVKILKITEGEVEAAIAQIKSEQDSKNQLNKEEFEVKGQELKQKVKSLIQQSNVTRLKIRRGDKVMLDIPVAAGIIGTAISPYLVATGVLAAMVTKCNIEVERTGEVSRRSSSIDNLDKV